jgi:hypothetical protein
MGTTKKGDDKKKGGDKKKTDATAYGEKTERAMKW